MSHLILLSGSGNSQARIADLGPDSTRPGAWLKASDYDSINSRGRLRSMTDKPGGKIIVGITGATGTIFGVRLLQILEGTGVETHLVISKWAIRTLLHETPYTAEEVEQMATRYYQPNDQGATISSGSFLTRGMIIAPCSVRTLGAIA